MISRAVNVIALAGVSGFLLLALAAFGLNTWLNSPVNLATDKILLIESGDTLSKIVYDFSSEGILRHPTLLIWYAQLTQRDQLKVGEYRIPAKISPEGLLDIFQSGQVLTYNVTLVEGLTFNDFLNILSKQEKVVPSLAGKNFAEIKARLKIDIEHPEGWFYPDTYQYTAGTRDVAILKQAHQKMKTVLDEEWANRADNLPYKNAYEALIMASIVEKETGVAHERGQIAGVFVRRLQKGMRLQTDPTIIYGLGDEYQGNIRRKHITQKTAYNTYVIDGLPPTPIAMPARQAIHAALNPKSGNSLFFVAKGDGSHQFSETYEQHKQAVQKYQIDQRKKNYQSAPSQPSQHQTKE
ncbi:MAG: endolytic transglycosylase MltG [Pseudomonadota bacterium]